MKLSDLAAGYPGARSGTGDPEIVRVVSDSRSAGPGTLFVAISGSRFDGLAFVASAIEAGAAAIASERPRPDGVSIPWLKVEDARHAAAVLSARAAGDPSDALRMAAVTGTNGKTTVAVLLESIFTAAFGSSGYLGTISYRWPGETREAPRTTPEGPVLADLLSRMRDNGVAACAMEVSSHALALQRVAGLRFDVAVFTNLTRDHFDFHGSFDDYYAAKRRLFDLRKPGGAAVVNTDDPYGRRLRAEVAGPVIGFSPAGDPAADFWAGDASLDLTGTRLKLRRRQGDVALESRLVGRFQIENILAASSAALSLDIAPEVVAAAVAECPGVPGRMERVDAGQPYPIIVDYAHTEDALRRLLAAVRELAPDRTLVVVFGCGGDRDAGKREPMGRAAAELSDIPIATSDNPRGEDPAEILRAVEAGLKAGGATKYLKFIDRREAIAAAIDLANSRSVVVIAGKGHETTQVVGGREFLFDDRRVAAELVRESGRAARA